MLQNTIKYTIEKELVPETELVRAEFMEHTVKNEVRNRMMKNNFEFLIFEPKNF